MHVNILTCVSTFNLPLMHVYHCFASAFCIRTDYVFDIVYGTWHLGAVSVLFFRPSDCVLRHLLYLSYRTINYNVGVFYMTYYNIQCFISSFVFGLYFITWNIIVHSILSFSDRSYISH